MQDLRQQWLEQAGPAQHSLKKNGEAQCTWRCTYRPLEDVLSAQQHRFFCDVSIAPGMSTLAHFAYMNVQIDAHHTQHEILCGALIRVTVKDTQGKALFQWESAVIDEICLRDSDVSHAMCMSIPIPCSLLDQGEEGGIYGLAFEIEDEQGVILDDTAGKIVLRAV